MRNQVIVALILFNVAVMAAACSQGPELPLTPAPDRPTFLYFYIEG